MLMSRGDAVKDRPALAFLKRIVRLLWSVDRGLRRVLRLGKRWRYWKLEGACNGCGSCCTEPSIHVGLITWHFFLARWLFVAWQARVNGLEYVGQAEEGHDLLFRCAHYQAASRQCDSYATRPSMCRDYPRGLLDQAWPELFPECGHRVRPRKAEALRDRIDSTALSPEAKAELYRKLRID